MFNKVDDDFYILNIEEIVKNSMIIKIGVDFIEIPNIVIFSKSKKLLHQFLNPSVHVLNISDEEFERMKVKINEKSSNININSITKPSANIIVNYEFLLNNLVFVKKEDSKLKVNGVVFTTDKSEFYGLGVAGVDVYFLKEHDFNILSSLIISIV